jgi:energy-coupling factor transport system permease protein
MDWLRQIPIGQYVDGTGSWLRDLDPRLKLAWTLAFLLTPILAGPWWRLALVGLLLLITALSGLPWRIWRRTLPLLLALSLLVGVLATLLPAGADAGGQRNRPPQELRLAPQDLGQRWELLRWGPIQLGPVPFGPLVITRRSAELGLNSATLLFTVIHSANLLLLTTPPEALVWGLSWCLMPLARLGVPVERLGFTLLLSLRFLPLVQEEFQNLLRSVATRSVNLRQLGLQGSLALVLALGERLLANVLLRAEQGADALLARGGRWIAPAQLLRDPLPRRALQWVGSVGLLVLLGLRWRYGDL